MQAIVLTCLAGLWIVSLILVADIAFNRGRLYEIEGQKKKSEPEVKK